MASNRKPLFPFGVPHFSFPQIALAQPQPVKIEISSSSDGSGSGSDLNRSGPKKRNGGGDPKKKDLFKRIWSLEDEIAVLTGMLNYRISRGANAEDNLADFHSFVKKGLKGEYTLLQLQYKVNKLRTKYRRNKAKVQAGQPVRAFCQAHEKKAYEQSKFVWGTENGTATRRAGKGVVQGECLTLSGGGGMEEGVDKAYAELFKGEREWKKMKVADLERHCKELEEQLAKSRFVLSLVKAAQS